MTRFNGSYQIEQIATREMCDVGLSDKPCYRITNDAGFIGHVWGEFKSPEDAAKHLFRQLGYRYPIVSASAFVLEVDAP